MPVSMSLEETGLVLNDSPFDDPWDIFLAAPPTAAFQVIEKHRMIRLNTVSFLRLRGLMSESDILNGAKVDR